MEKEDESRFHTKKNGKWVKRDILDDDDDDDDDNYQLFSDKITKQEKEEH